MLAQPSIQIFPWDFYPPYCIRLPVVCLPVFCRVTQAAGAREDNLALLAKDVRELVEDLMEQVGSSTDAKAGLAELKDVAQKFKASKKPNTAEDETHALYHCCNPNISTSKHNYLELNSWLADFEPWSRAARKG